MTKPLDHTEVLTRAATRILDLISWEQKGQREGHDCWHDDAVMVAEAVAILREELGVSACQKCRGATINLDANLFKAGLCGCCTATVACDISSIDSLYPFEPNVTLAAIGAEVAIVTPE